MITLERWRTIEPILDAALELSESERAAFVSQQCLSDPDLLSTLTRLLASIAHTDSEFDQPARSRWSATPPVAESHDDASRKIVGDRFRIEQLIGRAGPDAAHRAWDLRAQRRVVIRILTPQLAAGDTREHIAREVQQLAALRHPNLVPIFDSGESAGNVYVVMPFIEAESLRDVFASHDRLPRAEVRRIMRGVLSALECAHGAGVIHRDINPSNIILSQNEVLVANFGIASLAAPTDQQRSDERLGAGAPDYLSPEQADASGRADHRADIYGAGCILVEALTGQRPLPASVRQALANEGHDPDVRRIAARLASTPSLRRCAERAIALDPTQRFQSAREFSLALLDALDNETNANATGVAQHTSIVPASATRSRRSIVVLAVATALIAIAIAGTALARRERGGDGRAVELRTLTIFPFIARDTANRDTTLAADVTHGFLDYVLYSQYYTGRDGARLASPYGTVAAASPPTADHAAIVAQRGGGAYVDGTWWRDDSLHVTVVVHMEGRPAIRHSRTFRRGIPGIYVGGFTFQITMESLGHPDAIEDNVSHSGQVEGFIPTGLQAYRQQRYSDALRHFRDVSLREPPYPFAALIGAEAATWLGRQRDAQFMSDLALRGEMSVTASARALEMTRGFNFFVYDRADSSVAHFRRVVSRDGPALEAWLTLGTIYDRLAPRVITVDSLAAEALDHVRDIDDDFLPSLYPRLVFSARRGDTSTTAALLAQLNTYATRLGRTADFGTESNDLRAATIIARCTTRGVAAAPWDSVPAAALVEAARALTVAGLRQPDCARAAWEHARRTAGRDDRWSVLLGLQTVFLARGDVARTVSLLDTDTTVNRTARGWLAIADALAERDTALSARATVAADETLRLFQSYPTLISDEALWHLGLWLAHESQIDKLRIVHDTLLGRQSMSSNEIQFHFEQSLRARLALAQHDSAAAIALLTALAPSADRTTLTWTLSAGHGVDRALLAELLLSRNKFAESRDVASYFDSGASVGYAIFLWRSLQIRAAAAAALNDRAASAAIRQRQIALRPNAKLR